MVAAIRPSAPLMRLPLPQLELAFTKETIRRAERRFTRAQENSALAADLEFIPRGFALERYLPVLYGGTASSLELSSLQRRW